MRAAAGQPSPPALVANAGGSSEERQTQAETKRQRLDSIVAEPQQQQQQQLVSKPSAAGPQALSQPALPWRSSRDPRLQSRSDASPHGVQPLAGLRTALACPPAAASSHEAAPGVPCPARQKQSQQGEKSEVEPAREAQSKEEKAAIEAAVKQCTHCGSLRPGPPCTSYTWRRHPTSKEQLCGPCCGYSDRNGGKLPVVAWKEAAAAGANQPQKKQQGRQPPAAPAVDEEPPVSPRQHKQQRVADAAAAVGAERQSDAGAAGEQLLCSHCGADHAGPTPTYPWRKHATTSARLCKDCWDFSRKHYGFLPEVPQPAEPPQPAQPEGQEEQPAAGKGRQRSGTRWASGQEQGDAAAGDAQALQASGLLSLPGRRVTRHQQHQQEEQQQHGAVEMEAQATTAAGQASSRRCRRRPLETGETAAQEQQPPQQSPQRQCLQCASPTKGSGRWATWHRHPATGEEWLCQPCYQKERAAIQRQQRQPEKHRQEVESEEEEAQSEEEEEEEQQQQQPPQRQCLQCGSTSKGSSKSAAWHRHPATGEEWLCQPCFSEARAALQRQQRQAEKQRRQEVEREVGPEEDHSEEEAAIAAAVKQCTHCGALQAGPPGTSYTWRLHPTTRKQLCGPCGNYADKHGGELPALSDTALQRMTRGAEDAAAAEAQQPQNKQQGKRKKQHQQAPAVDEEPPVSPARRPKQRRVGDNQGFLPGLRLQPAQPLHPPVPSQPQLQQVQAQPQEVEPQQAPEGLFAHLLRAARQPAAAAAGLTPKLLASFWAVVDTTRSSQPSDRKVGWECPTASRRRCSLHARRWLLPQPAHALCRIPLVPAVATAEV